MTIQKAIIPVAGWGTRRLPITKTIEKCMLPIGNRPLVDYIVADCIEAGICDIYFVVSQVGSQLERYYSDNVALNDYLRAQGKEAMLPLVQAPENVTFHYIVQDANAKYGTAIPVSLVTDVIGCGESVVVLMGDDFIYNPDGRTSVQQLLEGAEEGQSAILGVPVLHEQVSRYGVLETDDEGHFKQIVEKPALEDAPSDMINVSKYILSPRVLREIQQYSRTERTSEYYITDPINSTVSQGEMIRVIRAEGEYLDGGTVEGWLYANNIVIGSGHERV